MRGGHRAASANATSTEQFTTRAAAGFSRALPHLDCRFNRGHRRMRPLRRDVLVDDAFCHRNELLIETL
ncbi:MAG: hypothetical protein JWL70_2563 [Acidimicrobiia bacterium]|nr:hypothetical protein [Acidimicrobiia bacterium]